MNVSVGVHTRIGCTRWQVIGATPSARLAEPRSRERVAEMIDFAGLGEWLDGDVSTLAFALEGACAALAERTDLCTLCFDPSRQQD